jgi:hypothetical protein
MATIEIGIETEGKNHWHYQVRVRDGHSVYDYSVTLSWSDYDLWCHGRVPPERVVRAAFAFLLEREAPEKIRGQFDCALIRRSRPEVDRELPKLL